MLTMNQGRITYCESPLPLLLRGFIGVIGLGVGLGIPGAWLANVNAQTSWAALAFVVIVVLVSALFGCVFILIALASATELRIDPTQPAVLRLRRGPLLNDSTAIPRHDFGPPTVIMRDSEVGPFPILRLSLAGRRRIEIACFDSSAEAERWRDTIAAALRA